MSTGARRRRLRRPLVLGPAVALLALAATAAAHGGHHHQHTRLRGPFATPSMAAFLKTRSGDITAAAFNLKTGRLFLYNPTLHGDDASIAKVDILATALYEAQQRGETLSPLQRELAQGAIENSDNDDAEDLWELDGGNPGIAAFNARVGMTQTILDPEGAWGLYESTARDQILLLEHIVRPNKVLSSASREYELDLMGDVESDQAWGVSAGVLSPAKVALKNGWLPVGEGWEINSIGQISGRFRDYLLAVLTSDDPDMPYGVETIEGISGIVWKYFLPPRYQGGGGHGS
ncbi:MAG TPA: serine hydrolase [Solirubrobacteraceae bacterium]